MLKNLFYISSLLLFVGCSSQKNTSSSEGKSVKELTQKQEVAFGRMYLDASKEKVLGNYEKAAKNYKEALTINPYSAAANYELGNTYNLMGNSELAFLQYEIASKQEPSNYWYLLSYASMLKKQGKLEESTKVFEQLIEDNPERIELKYEVAEQLMNSGKKKESIALLNDIEAEIGVNEDLAIWKKQAYLSMNDVDAAANEIQKLIDSNPSEIRYYGMLADIYNSNEQQDKALEVYKKMEELDADNYRVQFSLAEYYRREGKTELYLENIGNAFENPRMNIDDKVKYILTFYQVDSKDIAKKEEGISLVKKITKAHPENAKSFALLADFLYFNNQPEESKQAYFKTIALDSSRYAVWNQLLVILTETDDIKNLVNYGERSTELFPNQPTSYLLYGIGLAQDNQHLKAIDIWKAGADIVVDNQALKSQLYSSIGDSYHVLKDHTNSDAFYEKALTLDPNNVYVLNNYSYYLSLRKENLEKAKQMSAKSNNLAPNQSSFQDTYAWILFQLNEYEDAKIWIEKAISSSTKPSSELLEHKGDILFKLGSVNEAVEFWVKAKNAGNAGKLIDKKISEKKYYE